MEGLDLLHVPHWRPLQDFGYTHPFFTINAMTVINTWLVMLVLTILCFGMRYSLSRKKSVLRFLTMSYVGIFFDLVQQALGFFAYNHFCFMVALFSFIAMCNMISVFPGAQEPTQDINTTLALGCVAFLYTQIMVIKRHGFIAYGKEYFQPFFVMFPLNVVGHLASILSISFRLFGNIFGGVTITHLCLSGLKAYLGPSIIGLFALLLGSIMMIPITIIFGICEGLIQAFVFTMLSLTNLAMSIQESHDSPEAPHGNS